MAKIHQRIYNYIGSLWQEVDTNNRALESDSSQLRRQLSAYHHAKHGYVYNFNSCLVFPLADHVASVVSFLSELGALHSNCVSCPGVRWHCTAVSCICLWQIWVSVFLGKGDCLHCNPPYYTKHLSLHLVYMISFRGKEKLARTCTFPRQKFLNNPISSTMFSLWWASHTTNTISSAKPRRTWSC